ncbi:MAB_1171c family putative transporter [Actinokineospora spheciospongiae]|uniref:MAB_1171c family putative transporter n=1 Tax=Actinokineospora spheciospongiae TaxID=909613 RepID=UPI000557190D|nr:MAB_1171c family putative transporter [Actinokineospora spheciospongiae]
MAEPLRQWAPAAVAWLLLLSRWSAGDPTRRCVRLVLLGLACSLTAQIPAAATALGDLVGVPHAARLVSHLGMVLAVWAGQAFLALVNGHPRGARWQAGWAAGAATLMCALFVTMPDTFPQSPWVMEYCLVYALAQAPALAALVHLGLRHARQAQDRTTAISLRLVAAGAALGLLYLVNKSALATAPRLGFEFPFGRTALPGKVLPTTAYLLVLLAAALPACLGWLRRYRLHRRLGPLWRALHRADPGIALDPPAVPDALVLGNLRPRLYRRVIEIRDGLLALRPHRCRETAAAAHAAAVAAGLTGRELAAAVEAAAVVAALRSRAGGAPPTAHAAAVPGGTDLLDDADFLGAVSRRLAISPATNPARPGPGSAAGR